MPRPVNLLLPSVCATLGALVLTAAACGGTVDDELAQEGSGLVTQVSFQHGVFPSSSYVGASDTYLSQSSPLASAGASKTLKIDGDDPNGTQRDAVALLRWDVRAVPRGNVVRSATLTFNVANPSAGSFSIYALRRAWTESSSTWQAASAGAAWEAPGARGSGDRHGTLLGQLRATTTGAHVVVLNAAGLATVQAWVDEPSSNFGLVIDGPLEGDGVVVDSKERSNATLRPKLTVAHEPPPAGTPSSDAGTPPAADGGSAPPTLVGTGATWKYLDTGVDPDPAWRAASFDDVGWRSGPAQLGYGDGDEATQVAYGADPALKQVTTYFRKVFSVASPTAYASLTLELLRDDGAVVYLNGTEVLRSNLPAGTLTASTLANTALGGTDETSFVTAAVSPSLLKAGTNVLAVEVHQADRASSDLSFDLALKGTTASTQPPPQPGSTPYWPFDRPSLSDLRALPKKVFAHWHYYPLSFDSGSAVSDYYATQFLTPGGEGGKHQAYGGFMRERPLPRPARADAAWALRDAEEDVRMAAALGIDAFLVNLWADSGTLWTRWTTLFQAAANVGGGFKCSPNFDMSILASKSEAETALLMKNVLRQLHNHPGAYRMPDGRVLVGAFAAERRPASFYAALFSDLTAELGVRFYFVPVFLGFGDPYWSSYAPVSQALAGWGTAIPWGDGVGKQKSDAVHALGRAWMHPVNAQDFRPYTYNYWEASGTRALRTAWKNAIDGGADFAQIVTWNDQHEHHAVRPSTGKQHAFYDLTAYYITWFKTGRQPPIVRDVLYYSHRIHPSTSQPDLTQQSRTFVNQVPSVATEDQIELLGFLTAPGRLEVTSGGVVTGVDALAGITQLKAPLRSGRPGFALLRNGGAQVSFTSAFDVRTNIAYQDFLYRAGSSTRAAAGLAQSCRSVCEAAGPDACLRCPGEPVWLVANPP